jgi:o-succinylbenzoate---CoA ligase
MKTLFDLLREINPSIQIKVDSKFIISDKEIISLKFLNHKSISLANKLKHDGVKSGYRVPILIDNSPNFIISVLSLWMIEAIPVPINLKLSAPEIEELLKFLKCQYVLIDELFKEKINLSDIKQIELSFLNEGSEKSETDFSFAANRTAVIMFTSGSSGKPKAVELSFSNLIHSAIIGNKYLNQTTDDRWLASLPFYHIGGFSIIFRALIFGTAIIFPADLKIKSLHSSIQSFNPSLISLVSSQMSELLNNNIHPNRDLRHVLLGGGFIDLSIIKKALTKGWKVSKVYGSTETSSFVTILSQEEYKLKPESAGKAIPPNQIFIYDELKNELINNTEGEIVIKSPAIMQGYWNGEEATKQKLKNDLYYTGDMGYKDTDGFLYVVNRRSDLIVTGGENVNPIEIEEMILKYPKVKEVCVFGIDDAKWGQNIAAAIVPKPNEKFSLEDLKDFLKDKIASFKIPKEIYFVDELPKTELGKIKRETIREILN